MQVGEIAGERVQHGEEVGPALKRGAAILERIALRRVGDLVDEALDREGVLRRADRAPEHHRDMSVLEVDADLQRFGAIGTIGEALDRRAFDPFSTSPQPSERVIEPTAVRKSKPAGVPSALSAARIFSAACGR